jgi:hypothetical protein
MRKNKNSISKAKSYKEIGEFWGQTKKTPFEVDIESEVTYILRGATPPEG